MTVFPSHISFKGTWRPYQARVLKNLKEYRLLENKIHIVAPPGSGKTVLGLEIILHLGRPALILAPTVAIREQWLERFAEMFAGPEETPAYISTSLGANAPITVLTYQAPHTALKKGEGAPALFKGLNIRALVLDEAHHLRNEWYRALQELNRLSPKATTVSLTATPPYDVPLHEWQRYIHLCGEIDEEILVTELVADENICPHQDCVYFNFPTREEISILKETREELAAYLEALRGREDFRQALAGHQALMGGESQSETILSKPAYFTGILSFLRGVGHPIPRDVVKLIGNRASLPRPDNRWLERVLQGFLFDDEKSFPASGPLQAEMRKSLAALGCIRRRKVNITDIPGLSRLIMTSAAKLDSIEAITREEQAALGEELRLVILTDFIKKTADLSGPLREIGTLPIFEKLRRAGIPGTRPAILSGSFVLIPEECGEPLKAAAYALETPVNLIPSRFPGYLEAIFPTAGRSRMVASLTRLFEKGDINVLVGTAALLGEGWDAPSINALILASYVGSFMLSNQMRGRAIRVDKKSPEKTANIWHLVCMEPLWAYETNIIKQLALYNMAAAQNQVFPASQDYLTLTRRFKAFIGIGYTEDVVENGMDRLCFVRPPYTRANIDNINALMLKAAGNRTALRERWRQCLQNTKGVLNPYELTTLDNRLTARSFVFRDALSQVVAAAVMGAASQGTLRFAAQSSSGFTYLLSLLLAGGLLLASLTLLSRALWKFFNYHSPARSIREMGKALLKALQAGNFIESPNLRIISHQLDPYSCVCALEGGTTLEKRLFADCMQEMLGVIENPRYILKSRRNRLFMFYHEYYSVPNILGKKKDSALTVQEAFQRYVGPFELIYTRLPRGRQELLKAWARSFVNLNGLLLEGKTRVQSPFN